MENCIFNVNLNRVIRVGLIGKEAFEQGTKELEEIVLFTMVHVIKIRHLKLEVFQFQACITSW